MVVTNPIAPKPYSMVILKMVVNNPIAPKPYSMVILKMVVNNPIAPKPYSMVISEDGSDQSHSIQTIQHGDK